MTTTTMDEPVGDINRNRLFWMCCISLIVTAMTFAIRAGILGQLNTELGLTDTQLGWVNGMAFLGFPLAMVVFGLLYNYLGPRLIMILAFGGHLLGLVLTITASGFIGLLVSTFFIGFANGSVEAAANPMVAEMYKHDKTKWLNRFHVWFPGGIVIGALVSKFMTDAGLGWQPQIGIMLIPTAIYGFMVFTTKFPVGERAKMAPFSNIRLRDILLLLAIMAIMTLTTTSELGTQQWVERILGNTGASAMLILAMVTGIMAVGRFFAGPVIHALNPIGVLLMSAIVTSLGLFLLSIVTGPMVYLAAIVFAVGVCYFWPTMIGFTATYIPRSGALGMSLVGAAGMFALTFWNPVIGGWIDAARKEAIASGVAESGIELAAGQAALSKLVMFPVTLIVLFAIVFAARKWIERTAGEEGGVTHD